MEEAFNTVLPVLTLLLGAGLGNLLKLSELSKGLRLDAADQLADLAPLLWDRTTPDAWLRLNVALSRLAIRLNLAGVHPDLVSRVEVSAAAFWRSVHPVGQDDDGEIWVADENSQETWAEISTLTAELLGTNSRLKSWGIGRRARKLLQRFDESEEALLASVRKGD